MSRDTERLAAEMRELMNRIWDGDTKRSDEFTCWIMQSIKTLGPKNGMSQKDLDLVLRRLALLIHR